MCMFGQRSFQLRLRQPVSAESVDAEFVYAIPRCRQGDFTLTNSSTQSHYGAEEALRDCPDCGARQTVELEASIVITTR